MSGEPGAVPILQQEMEPMIEIATLILGPVETNVYLAADPATKEAVVIDPAWDGQRIAAQVRRRGWHLSGVWITHAHFDHIAGAAAVTESNGPIPVALHS